MIVAVVASVLLLGANAAFVAMEFALVGARPSRLDGLLGDASRRTRRRAHLALGSLRRLDYQLAGSQLGITLASLSLGYVAEPRVVHALEGLVGGVLPSGVPVAVSAVAAFVVGLGFVVFVHMVVGEMVPKGIAITAPERTLLMLVGPNRWYLVVVGPLVWLLNGIAAVVVRLVGVVPRRSLGADIGREGLVAMLDESRRHGAIERGAQRLLAGVLEFGGGTVDAVMVPWDATSAVTLDATVAEAEAVVASSGHSRLPVVRADGSPAGFVHAKDLLGLSSAASSLRIPLRLVRRVPVVPVGHSLEDLLFTMRHTGVHVALVADGVTDDGNPRPVGLVTLEDLLGELLGDLDDGNGGQDRH